MSRIRNSNTAPERTLRTLLRRAGLRPTPHAHLPGSPDLAFVRRRIAIFLDGCFWHGCPQHYIGPRTRVEFWDRKLRQNVDRDAAVDAALHTSDIRVIRVWQHELSEPTCLLNRILAMMATNPSHEAPGFRAGPVWWRCRCGSTDAQVVALVEPGSLKPASKRRPRSATLRCRACGAKRSFAVPKASTTAPPSPAPEPA